MATKKPAGTPATADEIASAKRETWVFVGKRLDADDKISFVWKEIGDGGEPDYDADDHCFSGEVVPAMPGALYEFSILRREGNRLSILGNGREYKGVYGASSLTLEQFQKRQEWHLKHKAAETAFALLQRRKKELASDPIKEHLEPLRVILKKQIGLNRRVMIAEIMEYLTR